MKDNKPTESGQSWEQWSNYVLITLEKIEKRVDDVEESINSINLKSQTDIVELKTRSALASVIVSIIMSLIVGIASNVIADRFQKPDTPTTPPAYQYKMETIPQPKYEQTKR